MKRCLTGGDQGSQAVTSPQTETKAARDAWDRSAAGWDEHAPVIRRWLYTATQAMLDMAAIGPGSRVLDVAAGAGDQTLDIAQRVGPQGRVLATDLSPLILERAKSNCRRAGCAQVETLVGDAEELAVEPASFDAAVSRLGLMLFPHPLRAIRAMHAALRPAGGVCTMVFGRPERNPCITILMRTALEHAGLPMREPMQPGSLLSLGQPSRLDGLFREAGFSNVATTLIDAPFALPSAREYVEFVRSSASPVQQILSGLEPDKQLAAWDDIEAQLARFQSPSGWIGPNELALTAARR